MSVSQEVVLPDVKFTENPLSLELRYDGTIEMCIVC